MNGALLVLEGLMTKENATLKDARVSRTYLAYMYTRPALSTVYSDNSN